MCGIFNNHFFAKFSAEHASGSILKIGQYLMKLEMFWLTYLICFPPCIRSKCFNESIFYCVSSFAVCHFTSYLLTYCPVAFNLLCLTLRTVIRQQGYGFYHSVVMSPWVTWRHWSRDYSTLCIGVARFFCSHGAKHWQKVARNRLISIHKAVSSDLNSSPKLAMRQTAVKA